MKIFIDGSAGTTGLRIKDRLMKRSDVELLTLGEKERKDPESRKRALNGADAAFSSYRIFMRSSSPVR